MKSSSPGRSAPLIGFVTHPFEGISRGRIDLLAEFPATAELANVFAWKMTGDAKPETVEEIAVDFETPNRWFQEVCRSGRAALPILDIGIHHTETPWRAALTDRAGENLVGIEGKKRGWSSLHSPVYRRSALAYIDQIVDWVRRADSEGRIPAYIDGAEWFWPWETSDYSDLAVTEFRRWLKAKYETIQNLNTAWGVEYGSWEDAEPVRPFAVGEWTIGKRSFSLGGPARFAWESPEVGVTPGVLYEASVEITANGVPEGLVDLTFVWQDAGGRKIAPWRADAFSPEAESPHRIHGRAVAPAGAVTVRLALKLWGHGTVCFSDPELRNLETGASLLPSGVCAGSDGQSWCFTNDGRGTARFEMPAGRPVLTIEASPLELPWKHSSIAHGDWIEFGFESMAAWLNETARHITKRDPGRPVASYVGWIFGMHNMWDGVQVEQRFDISLVNTPDIDINGFQLAIAGDDFSYATFNIDLARKYGKPMWGTDLVDFPYGLFSGFNSIYRGSLACAQHGLSGFFYYNWHGTSDYSYSEHLATCEIHRLLNSVKEAVAGLEDYTLETDVALLLPILPFSLADPGGQKGDMLDAGGLYRLILDLGLTPDAWTPYEIEKLGGRRLLDYRLLFIPDCPALPDTVNEALIRYVHNGGSIVGCGRWPAFNMKGEPLREPLVTENDGGDPVVSLCAGKGKVVWQTAKVGRDYVGKVRRVQVYGNTPSVFVEQPDPARTPESQRLLRRRVDRMVKESGFTRPVRIDLDPGTIHLATWKANACGSRKIFLVNRAGGRLRGPALKLDPGRFAGHAHILIDMERECEQPIEEDGTLSLPSFAHSAIVRCEPTPARREAFPAGGD